MEWLWVVCAFVAGVVVTAHGYSKTADSDYFKQSCILATDHKFMTTVLRRELANWMIRKDPNRYLQIYKQAHSDVNAIKAAAHSEQAAQLAQLCQKYNFYIDFDLIGARDYVLYDDAMNIHEYDDVKEHYINIVRFQALQCALDKTWRPFDPTSDDELAHLEGYVKRIKDTHFKCRLRAAVGEYKANQKDRVLVYETDTFSVRPVAHSLESRLSVHFKNTDEYGLCTIYVYDTPNKWRGPLSMNFYRSDIGFEKTTFLDDLQVDMPL